MKFRRKSAFLTLAAVVLVVAAALFAVVAVSETQEQDPNQVSEAEASFTLNGVTYPQNPVLQDFLDRGWVIDHVTGQQGDCPDGVTKPSVLYDTGYRLVSGEDEISVGLVYTDVKSGLDASECRVANVSFYSTNVESFYLFDMELIGVGADELREALGTEPEGSWYPIERLTYYAPEVGIHSVCFTFLSEGSEANDIYVSFVTENT